MIHKSMQHIWSVLCKSSSIDQDTNLITLRDCLEQLNVTILKKLEKNVVPIESELINFWYRDKPKEDKKFEVKIELYDPKNEKIHEFSGLFSFPQNKKRMRTRMQMKGLPVTSTGKYIFKVKLRTEDRKPYKEITEIPLDITIAYK